MGSGASKTTRAAASSARKFPSTPSASVRGPSAARAQQAAQQQQHPGPTVHPPPVASATKTQVINLDADDPVYAQHLRQMGAVQPNPFLSHSSQHPSDPRTEPSTPNQAAPSTSTPQPSLYPDPASNPALMILQARQRFQMQAEKENDDAGSRGFAGKSFIDVHLLQQILMERARGIREGDIEKKFGLRGGTLARLGSRDIVDIV